MSSNPVNTMADGWPEARQFKRTIRLEFSLYISLLILLMMLASGYVITNQYVTTVTRNVAEKLLVQARSYSMMAGKHIISADRPDALMLSNTCKKLAADNPDIYWVGITGQDSVFLAHTDIKEVVAGSRLVPPREIDLTHSLRAGETFKLGADTIAITLPIMEKNVLLGWFGLTSSTRQIREARRTSIITVTTITIAMLLVGLPITMVILHRKLRPLSIITDSLRRIDFDDLSLNIPVLGKNEFGYLGETLRVMGIKLNLAQKDLVEKERISRELEIAREIQANILPRDYPQRAEFETYGTYRSAKEIGGDYYDFIEFDDTRLGILVADVSGKSLPGMLVMLLTRDIVKRLTRTIQPPAEILAEVNKELLGNIKKGMFVTMFFGILDTVTGEFSFASAGHNPLLHVRAETGKCDLIKTKGFPLGMMPAKAFDARIESGKLKLAAGDWLVQYTDGVNEAQNQAEEEFGLDRFINLAEQNRQEKPREFVEEILRHHQLFVGDAAQYDDITMLVLNWQGHLTEKSNTQFHKVAHAG